MRFFNTFFSVFILYLLVLSIVPVNAWEINENSRKGSIHMIEDNMALDQCKDILLPVEVPGQYKDLYLRSCVDDEILVKQINNDSETIQTQDQKEELDMAYVIITCIIICICIITPIIRAHYIPQAYLHLQQYDEIVAADYRMRAAQNIHEDAEHGYIPEAEDHDNINQINQFDIERRLLNRHWNTGIYTRARIAPTQWGDRCEWFPAIYEEIQNAREEAENEYDRVESRIGDVNDAQDRVWYDLKMIWYSRICEFAGGAVFVGMTVNKIIPNLMHKYMKKPYNPLLEAFIQGYITKIFSVYF